MTRKFLSILLVLSMLLSLGAFSAQAKFEDGVATVDFESGDFEGGVAGGNVKNQGIDYNQFFSVTTEKGRDGKVLCLEVKDDAPKPHMGWDITGITPGAKYKFTGYYKWDAWGTGFPQVFLEYFGGENKSEYYSGESRNLTQRELQGKWAPFEQVFEVPFNEKINTVTMYVRLHGDGKVCFDDLKLELAEEIPYLTVDYGFFYYRDEPTGEAEVQLNTKKDPDYEGKSLSIKLMDGETVLEEATYPAQKDLVVWKYPTMKMTEVGKSYFMHFEYIDKDGTVLEQNDKEVLIYNRPKNLTKEGYILDDDGSIIPAHVALGLGPSNYKRAKETGITIAMCTYQAKDLKLVLDALDKAQEAGIKLMIPLYSNMYPAAYPDNIKLTTDCIKAVKNHPALAGYAVMDEPFGNAGRVGGIQEMYQLLQDSYKLIRSLDEDHFIYIVETNMKYVNLAVRCSDAPSVDPYIGYRLEQRGTKVSTDVADAIAVGKGRKPAISIVQAWNWNGGNGDVWYVPDANDIRSFLYQSYISGASGIGYYKFESTGNPSEPKIWDYPLIDGVNYFVENEWEDAQKAFLTGEYPTFAQNTDPDASYWYKAFVKGKDLYVVVINREVEETEIEIPLTSIDGSVTIGAFKAEADKISGMAPISGEGTLKATLGDAQVVRFKLTVRDDLSGLTTSRYRDIYDYAWAKPSIDRMYQKGVTNQKGVALFAPAEQITRGDFAMFLVKTLGLTAKATDNFADVNPYAEYAEAISIGKALGILKGTDGVNFNPETPISRQDFMVICARGMRLKKNLQAGDASQFADAASIADYAVEDIAAMVTANIVAGYEDGTVRPLGNATRAEAAVIMDRITNWNK